MQSTQEEEREPEAAATSWVSSPPKCFDFRGEIKEICAAPGSFLLVLVSC